MIGCEERNMRKIDRRFGTGGAVAVAGVGACKGIPLTLRAILILSNL